MNNNSIMSKNILYLANIKKGVIYEIEKTLIPDIQDILENSNVSILKTPEDIIQADFDIFFKDKTQKTLEDIKSEYKDEDDLLETILLSDTFYFGENEIEEGYYYGIHLSTIILDFTYQDILDLEKS